MFIGNKFTAFTRNYRTNAEVRRILDDIIRKTAYKTPLFLRETRDGRFLYDYFDKGKIMRAVFDNSLNKLSEKMLQIHPEYEGVIDEDSFFGQLSITEPYYRRYYVTKFFKRNVNTERLNFFATKIKDDDIEGLMMYHGYTRPFIEYVVRIGKHIIVTDKPLDEVKKKIDFDLPDPFEYHIIDEENCQKTMLFARIGDVEIMYPETVSSLDDTIKVPTKTDGVLRLIPVPVNDPNKLLERIRVIAENPRKIYIRENKTTIITDNGKIIVFHDKSPRIKHVL